MTWQRWLSMWRALRSMRRACATGAPYTTQTAPHHKAMLDLEKLGLVTGRQVGGKTFWSEVEA